MAPVPLEKSHFYDPPRPADGSAALHFRALKEHSGIHESYLQPLHKKKAGAWVSIRGDGREIKIQRRPTDGTKGGDPPTREKNDIDGFSESSRRRLRQVFDRLRRDAPCVFLTLSYHRKDPSCEEAKADLHAFIQELRRRYERVAASVIWRMEWQARGVPHFHLLIYGIRHESRDALKRSWHRITGESSLDRKHRLSPLTSDRWDHDAKVWTSRRPVKGGHRIDAVYPGPPHRSMGAWVETMGGEMDEEKVRNYVAKYHCKTDAHQPPDGEWQGRHWGIRMRESLPVAPVTQRIRVSYRLAYALVETCLEQWGSDVDIVPYSLTVSAERPAEKLDELIAKAAPKAART